MKIGDTVEWSSQAAGYKRTKRGEIIEVVPPKAAPVKKPKDRGMIRDHESYVVRAAVVDGSDNQRRTKRIYWPRVSQLRSVDVRE